MSLPPDPGEVTARIRSLARASDLRRDRRLATKIDLEPAAVSRRLRSASQVTSLCLKLGGRAPGDDPSLAQKMRALGSDCATLGRLLAEEREVVRVCAPGSPPAAELDALAGVRRERERIAASVPSRLREDGPLSRHLAARYAGLLGEDVRRRGFAGTPRMRSLVRDLVDHLPVRPVLVLGPPGFPVEGLVRSGLEADPGEAPSDGLLEPAAVVWCDLARGGPRPITEALATPGVAAIVVAGLLGNDDWGLQREVCDRCVRRRIALILTERVHPASLGADSFHGYVLPAMEAGVAARVHKLAVPPVRPVDDGTLRGWLMEPVNWSEGRLPLVRLPRGLIGGGPVSSPTA